MHWVKGVEAEAKGTEAKAGIGPVILIAKAVKVMRKTRMAIEIVKAGMMMKKMGMVVATAKTKQW